MQKRHHRDNAADMDSANTACGSTGVSMVGLELLGPAAILCRDAVTNVWLDIF